jgi:NTE family protein
MRGLVLSGGGARGLAHIGVLEVLERWGFEAQVLSGTSMGAIVGALWACGKTAAEILELARKAPWLSLFDFSMSLRLINPSKLERYLGQFLPPTFEELPRKLVVVATDLPRGQAVYLHRGALPSAVVASAAIPGVIGPVMREERLLVDGGVLDNLPIVGARFLGAEKVLAVDVTPDDRSLRNTLGQVRHSARIMQQRLTQLTLAMHPPDLYIKPRLDHVGIEHFERLEEVVEAGRQAALEALGEGDLASFDFM